MTRIIGINGRRPNSLDCWREVADAPRRSQKASSLCKVALTQKAWPVWISLCDMDCEEFTGRLQHD